MIVNANSIVQQVIQIKNGITAASTQRPKDVPLLFYFRQDTSFNIIKLGRIRLLTYFGSTRFGLHLASGSIEKFP